MLASAAGLAGCTVSATLIAAGRDIQKDLLEQCRSIAPETGERSGITALPQLLLARYLGHSGEAAMHYFTALWSLLRPALAGRSAVPPRIWRT
jgi:urease accessory protein